MARRGGKHGIDQPHPVDVHVGGRVRFRRQVQGMSQGQLAAKLGLTFQQVQKYERGVNRISASRLWELSEALEVPLTFFFEGTPTSLDGIMPTADESEGLTAGGGTSKEMASVVRSFGMIRDSKVRQSIASLVKTCADSDLQNAGDKRVGSES